MRRWYFLSPLILQKLIWVPTRLLLSWCGHISSQGFENLAKIKTNLIFACNHTSEMDVFFIPGILPFFSRFSPIFYTSRENKFYQNSGWRKHFYGGVFFKMLGAYPVKVGLHDYELSTKRHVQILNDGGNLCVFPEGRVTPDGMLQPAKGGVAYLAHKTGLPIVPVYLGGAFKLSPIRFFLGRGRLSISFGEPIHIAGQEGQSLSVEDYKTYARMVMEKIAALKPLPEMQPAAIGMPA